MNKSKKNNVLKIILLIVGIILISIIPTILILMIPFGLSCLFSGIFNNDDFYILMEFSSYLSISLVALFISGIYRW